MPDWVTPPDSIDRAARNSKFCRGIRSFLFLTGIFLHSLAQPKQDGKRKAVLVHPIFPSALPLPGPHNNMNSRLLRTGDRVDIIIHGSPQRGTPKNTYGLHSIVLQS